MTPKDLLQIKNIVEEVVEQKLEQKLTKELKPIKKQLNKIQKDLTTTINFFDSQNINHEKRIRKIESHLGFPQAI